MCVCIIALLNSLYRTFNNKIRILNIALYRCRTSQQTNQYRIFNPATHQLENWKQFFLAATLYNYGGWKFLAGTSWSSYGLTWLIRPADSRRPGWYSIRSGSEFWRSQRNSHRSLRILFRFIDVGWWFVHIEVHFLTLTFFVIWQRQILGYHMVRVEYTHTHARTHARTYIHRLKGLIVTV